MEVMTWLQATLLSELFELDTLSYMYNTNIKGDENFPKHNILNSFPFLLVLILRLIYNANVIRPYCHNSFSVIYKSTLTQPEIAITLHN